MCQCVTFRCQKFLSKAGWAARPFVRAIKSSGAACKRGRDDGAGCWAARGLTSFPLQAVVITTCSPRSDEIILCQSACIHTILTVCLGEVPVAPDQIEHTRWHAIGNANKARSSDDCRHRGAASPRRVRLRLARLRLEQLPPVLPRSTRHHCCVHRPLMDSSLSARITHGWWNTPKQRQAWAGSAASDD